jgi:hypothetical protein
MNRDFMLADKLAKVIKAFAKALHLLRSAA